MNTTRDPEEIPGRSPERFAFDIDPREDRMSFISLSRSDYDEASFLDARVLTPGRALHTVPWVGVRASIEAAALEERCDYIFHIGHVGSTLLSRLMGTHPAIFALREPMILRTFAALRTPGRSQRLWSESEFDARLGGALKLLSRTFEPRQRPVVKVTSFVSELAHELLSRAAAPRALMLYVSPESYLATILGGPNSRREARILTPERLRRLNRRLGAEFGGPGSLGESEALALGWACEMSALALASRAAGDRILRIDFDRFLARPAAGLTGALRHFRVDASADEVSAILQGPHMRRYSKAPEYEYDAALRNAVLNQARALHRADIRRGLAWLDRVAASFAPLHDAMAFAAGATS